MYVHFLLHHLFINVKSLAEFRTIDLLPLVAISNPSPNLFLLTLQFHVETLFPFFIFSSIFSFTLTSKETNLRMLIPSLIFPQYIWCHYFLLVFTGDNSNTLPSISKHLIVLHGQLYPIHQGLTFSSHTWSQSTCKLLHATC